MIRGAIALGLAIRAYAIFTEYDVMVTSVLLLVILSTLIFGSFMPLVARCLLDPPTNKNHDAKRSPTITIETESMSQAKEQLLSSEFNSGSFPVPNCSPDGKDPPKRHHISQQIPIRNGETDKLIQSADSGKTPPGEKIMQNP